MAVQLLEIRSDHVGQTASGPYTCCVSGGQTQAAHSTYRWRLGDDASASDIVYLLQPVMGCLVEVDSDQLWFWAEKWQEGERRAEEELRTGEYESFDSMDEFLATL